MQVSVEAGEGLERRMTIQVPEEQISAEVQKRLQSMGRNVKVDGFRPGKVPMKVLQRNYGGQVRNEVVSGVLQSSFMEAVAQEKLNPAGGPSIDTVDAAPGQGLSYTAVFEVYPEIPAPDVAGVKVSRPVAEVTSEDVAKMIETLRQQRRTWAEVERAASDGDRVSIDYTGTIDGQGFAGNSNKQVPVELGSGKLIDGFEEGLVGAVAGEERTLDLRFPDDYHSKEVAGKEVSFSVTVTKVEEGRLPEADDEFFRSFGVESGGAEAFQSEIRSNMERELGDAIQARVKQQTLDALMQANPIELPQVLIKEEAGRLMQQTRDNLVSQGAGSPDMQLDEGLFMDQAGRRVSLGLLLSEIAKANTIKADPDKVRAKVESIAASYEQPDQVVKWYYTDRQRLAEIESVVLEDQIVAWILDHAQVSEEGTTFDAMMKPGQTS